MIQELDRSGGPAKTDTVAVETLNADEIRPVDLNRVRLHYNDLERVA